MATICYLISYDLRNYDKDYSDLYKAIGKLSYSKRVLESFRFVKSTKSIDDLFVYIKNVMDSDDGLYITLYSGSAKWSNINCQNSDIKGQCL